jgi:putative peptidoglycan lipid II flippase
MPLRRKRQTPAPDSPRAALATGAGAADDGHAPAASSGEAFALEGSPDLALTSTLGVDGVEMLQTSAEQQAAQQGRRDRRIVATAGIIAVGQLLSSILGFVRITVLNVFFYPIGSGAFVTALRPIQQVSDLLVGGSVSGALIPTFVDHAGADRQADLRRIYSTVANTVLIVMALAVLALFFIAPVLIPFEVADYPPAAQQLTVLLVRIGALGLFGLGLYAVTSALLYASRQSVYPAFATSAQHLGVIAVGLVTLFAAGVQLGIPLDALVRPGAVSDAVAHARTVGAGGLAVGFALGALGEFLLCLPGLRRVGVVWQPVLDFRHPAVRQIFKLYIPIAAGLIISVLYQNLDVSLVGRTPGGAPANATALQSGTVLIQFPVGLVAAALTFAVLPALTSAASADDLVAFKRTLRMGLRLGLLLMVPAAVGLITLRMPIVALLFQHGSCDHGCTVRNALAVQNYGYELPFIAADQLLIAAFYSRKNTLIPNIVGVVSILAYVAIAVPFVDSIGMPALAFGDTAKNTSHALILFVLLTFAIGNLGLRDLAAGVGRILLAGAAMTLSCLALVQALPALAPRVFDPTTTRGDALLLLAPGLVGVVVYFALAALLRLDEMRLLGGIVRSRLGRSR